jgi:hypothetical protein
MLNLPARIARSHPLTMGRGPHQEVSRIGTYQYVRNGMKFAAMNELATIWTASHDLSVHFIFRRM